MSSVLRKQDMPPTRGYAPIIYKRIPCKSYFNGYTMIAMYFGVTAASLYVYGLTHARKKREMIENRSAGMAILPLLVAEKDREYLRQLRRNRDYETELMKNVEGWEVGTLDGERLYKSVDEDFLHDPTFGQFYAHSSWKAAKDRIFLHQKV